MESPPIADRIWIGTAGWSYPDWIGPIYPASRTIDRLRFLARYVDCIELNSSFYRVPGKQTVRRWVERIGDLPRFLFTVKAWRAITHERTTDDGAVRRFIDAFSPLEEAGRIGAWLLQFPWSFRRDAANLHLLDRLGALLSGRPVAVELRHGSWNNPETAGFLADRDLAFCNIDQPVIGDSMPPTAHATTPRLGYIRLHGRNRAHWFDPSSKRDERYDYLYDEGELSGWHERAAAVAPRVDRLFIVANNHFRGQALVNAVQLRAMLEHRRREAPPSLIALYPQLRGVATAPNQGNLLEEM